MDNQPVTTTSNTAIQYQIAETGERLANYLIDLVVFLVIYFGINVIFDFFAIANGKQSLMASTGWDKFLDIVFRYLIYMIFYCFCEGASHGRSIGKLITRTKAIKRNGSSVTWEDAFMRSLCRIIPFEPFSALLGNPWHDELTKTKVVKMK